jgi:hypothetical protein
VNVYPLPSPYHDRLVKNLRQWQRSGGAQAPGPSDQPQPPPLPDELFGMLWLYLVLNGQPLVRPATWLTH